ncbi:MAG: pro-sigmaK processing inhibitor BofA family protein [Ruminococcus sp.]|nr:pro-sigmaK processing inhibitor BofA family protein [Ruminococcus sp.]
MANKLIKIIKKLCLAFVMLYGLNLILNGINFFIPINLITLSLVTFLGTPGILGLVIIYFLI